MSTTTLNSARKAALLVAALGASAAGQAEVLSLSNAAYAATFVRDCRSAGNTSNTPDRCEANAGFNSSGANFGFTPQLEIKEQMTLNGYVAGATATNALGIAGGEATRSLIDASGAAGTLNLKQGVFSQATSRVSGHSMALQSFLYTGAPETRTLQNVFDFSASSTPLTDLRLPGAGGVYTGQAVYAFANVLVFSLSSASFDFNPSLAFDVQDTAFAAQAMSRSDYREEASVMGRVLTVDDEAISLSFNVESGRTYFVQSYLGLWGRFGGTLDATHTFTSTLGQEQTDGLGNTVFTPTAAGFSAAAPSDNPLIYVNGVPQVPEPGTFMMGALGLAVLGWVRRRER